MNDLWFGTRGSRDAKIVLVGESWGFQEDQQKQPFVGESGSDLMQQLAEAKINPAEVLFTNMVAARPERNETWRFFYPKDTKPQRIAGCAPMPIVRDGIRQLYSQIAAYPRSVVIGAGNWPLWALTKQAGIKVQSSSNNQKIPKELQTWTPNGIMNWRGSQWYCEPHEELLPNGLPAKVLQNTRFLPIIHPAAIQRAWYNRSPTVHDLRTRVPKGLRGEWRPNPMPEFWAPPTYQWLLSLLRQWRIRADSGERIRLAADIETARGLITCLGIADSPRFAVSIPFIRRTAEGGFTSWWSVDEEAEIISRLRQLFLHPNILIEGQNFIYDTQYIQHYMGVTPKLDYDTMLGQNVMFPGTPKGLDYLSSMYCEHHWFWKEDHKEWDLSGTIEDLLVYNCWDCVRTWEVAENQRTLLKHLGMESQMAWKMRINDKCLRMMNRGFLIDRQRRAQMFGELTDASAALESELLQIIPQRMVDPDAKTNWYNSSQQTAWLLYDYLGMEPVLDNKTKRPTVGKKAFPILTRKYPEFSGLFRRLDEIGSVDNSAQVIQAQLDPDNRMRCSYNPGGTETHRLSSSKNTFGKGTNLQNLTKGKEDE